MTKEVEKSGTTRRAFLGAAALTAASYNRVLGANDRIGVGQIGFGLIGKQHIADMKSTRTWISSPFAKPTRLDWTKG